MSVNRETIYLQDLSNNIEGKEILLEYEDNNTNYDTVDGLVMFESQVLDHREEEGEKRDGLEDRDGQGSDQEGRSAHVDSENENQEGRYEGKEEYITKMLNRITGELLPEVKKMYAAYSESYEDMIDVEKRQGMIDQITLAHSKDSVIVRDLSDEYLKMDDDLLAVYSMDEKDILKRTMEMKAEISKCYQGIVKKRHRIEQLQIANHNLKQSLIKFMT